MSGRRPTLFVTGFPPDIRAKDLALEFEKFGEIIRCDVPAPAVGRSSRYAFIEYVNEDDAAKAHKNLHGESFDGSKLIVEWAKRTPGSRWRPGGAPPPPREGDMRDGRGYGDRDRGDRGDRDRERERPPRGEYRERERRPDRERERERPIDVRREREVRERSRSPRRGAERERPREDRPPREERPPREDRERGERMERGDYTRRSPRGGGGGERRREDMHRERERDVDMAPIVRRSATPPPKGVYENGRY